MFFGGCGDVLRFVADLPGGDTLDESVGNSRFDDIIASDDLNPVYREYDPDSFDYSDHAAIIADLEI